MGYIEIGLPPVRDRKVLGGVKSQQAALLFLLVSGRKEGIKGEALLDGVEKRITTVSIVTEVYFIVLPIKRVIQGQKRRGGSFCSMPEEVYVLLSLLSRRIRHLNVRGGIR